MELLLENKAILAKVREKKWNKDGLVFDNDHEFLLKIFKLFFFYSFHPRVLCEYTNSYMLLAVKNLFLHY